MIGTWPPKLWYDYSEDEWLSDEEPVEADVDEAFHEWWAKATTDADDSGAVMSVAKGFALEAFRAGVEWASEEGEKRCA